ncbi:unnamed protein product [Phyllotreta striolata]|uniref:RING-type domain-containing protein n=1 Tax=Phyllotreta striolata TaxID=444603 RepID=A0A9N9XS80_PHYSR|nr:unnamed protein product [Phyllotreta striolata]
MNDWLHCNQCLTRYQADIKFYLIECAHILCGNCIKQIRDSKCLICDKPNDFILIDKDMHSSAQPFFVPFESHLKKLQEVFNFQSMHRQRLFQCQLKKYQFLKKEMFCYHQKTKEILSENKMMRGMLMNNNRQQGSYYPTSDSFSPSISDDMSFVSSVASFTPNVKSTPIPGFARRVQGSLDRSGVRGLSIPQNQPHLHGGTGFYRPSPGMGPPSGAPPLKKFNMATVHKTPSTAASMSQLHSKRQ